MLNFTCDAADLRRWIPLLKGSLPKRNWHLPVLNGVQIARTAGSPVRLTTTDLELTTRIHVADPGGSDGAIVVPFDHLVSASKGTTGPIVVTQSSDDEAVIASSNGTITCRLLPADEYPRLDMGTGAVGSFSVSTDRAKRVLVAAGRDDARPILTGVLLDVDNQRLVTTDSYRLAITPAVIDLPNTTYANRTSREATQCDLVPRTGMEHFLRLAGKDVMLNVEVHDRSARMVVQRDGEIHEAVSVLIEGEFPPYERLFPTVWDSKLPLPGSLVAKVKALKGGCGAEPLHVNIRDGLLTVEFTVQDRGTTVLHTEPLEGYVDGSVGLNPEYLSQGIVACGGGDVELHLQDHLKPTAMAGAGVWYLLMPVRTASNAGFKQVASGHELAPPTLEDVKALDDATPGPAPKRTGKPDLVTFLRSVVRDLPAEKQAEAERLLAAA